MLTQAFFFFFWREKIDLAQAFLIAFRSNKGPPLRLHRLGHRLIIKEGPQKL